MKINQQTLILGGLASIAATLFVTRPQLFNSLFPGSAVASQPNQPVPTQPSTPVDPCEGYLSRPHPEQVPGSFYGY